MASNTTIGKLRNGTMRFITPPEFNQNFRADMNSIGATWGNVGGKGSWIFKPEHMDFVRSRAAVYFPVPVAQPAQPAAEPQRSDREAFAVAMGLGLREQEDLF